jgi:uncharacterized protein YodC (DUF2158 family)
MTKQNLCDVVVGDLVQLNSGGPQLTVSAINGDWITVVWIGDLGESGRYGKAEFPRECLHKV